MIAFRAEARRWAKYAGAPVDVVRRAHVYREREYSGHNERSTATVEDEGGNVIWLRRLDAKRTAARAMIWVKP